MTTEPRPGSERGGARSIGAVLLLAVVGVVVALLIARSHVDRIYGWKQPPVKSRVLIARSDLPAGEPVEPDDLEWREFSPPFVSALGDRAIEADFSHLVVGLAPRVEIAPGEILSWLHFTEDGEPPPPR